MNYSFAAPILNVKGSFVFLSSLMFFLGMSLLSCYYWGIHAVSCAVAGHMNPKWIKSTGTRF